MATATQENQASAEEEESHVHFVVKEVEAVESHEACYPGSNAGSVYILRQ